MTFMSAPPRPRLRAGLWAAPSLCLSLCLLSACSQMPDYRAPFFDFASTFRGQPEAGPPTLLRNSAWWRSFEDPVLDLLVTRALAQNLDLELAVERVTQARAELRTISSGASLDGEVAFERQGGSDRATVAGPDADVTVAWLLDPFGGRAARREAALARVEVADAEVDAARLLMLNSLVSAYSDLRFTEASLALRNEELASRRRSLGLISDLFEAETVTSLDVVRARALLSETRAQIPALEVNARARMNEIAVLLGQVPGSVTLPPGRAGRQLAVPGSGSGSGEGGLALAVPADLVRNRPDIRIAERRYYAAVAGIGAARAALFPSLSLSGTISASAFGGSDVTTYGFGPSLTLPALPTGPRRAAVEVAESEARQALTTWKSTVISAIGAVETALADYQAGQRTVAASRRSVALYREAVGLTRELLINEGATTQELLDAERRVASARIALATAERSLARSYTTLNITLGAGSAEAGGDADGDAGGQDAQVSPRN